MPKRRNSTTSNGAKTIRLLSYPESLFPRKCFLGSNHSYLLISNHAEWAYLQSVFNLWRWRDQTDRFFGLIISTRQSSKRSLQDSPKVALLWEGSLRSFWNEWHLFCLSRCHLGERWLAPYDFIVDNRIIFNQFPGHMWFKWVEICQC